MFEDFVAHYIACALWSSTDHNGVPMDVHYTPEDIHPVSLRTIRRDCADFVRDNTQDLAEYADIMSGPEWTGAARAGHDFWLTRNGHGAGYWDRGLGALGKRLTDAAHACGTSDLYVGDDGRIHVFP